MLNHSESMVRAHWQCGILWQLPAVVIKFDVDKASSDRVKTHIKYICHKTYLGKFMPWRDIISIRFSTRRCRCDIKLRSMDNIDKIFAVYGEFYTKASIIF